MKHLYYEVWMLQETAKRLLHDLKIHSDRVVKNSMVESCCVHARALTGFLYPECFSRREGDVTVADYVTDFAGWMAVRGEIPDILVLVKERTGKEVAHLTADRKEYGDPDKEWNLVPIADALHTALKLFIRHAAPQRLDPFVTGYISGLTPPIEQSRIVVYEVGSTGIMTASGPSASTSSQVVLGSFDPDSGTRRAGEPE